MNRSELVVSHPILGEVNNLHQVSATIRGPDIDGEVWFRSATQPDISPPFAPETFLAMGLFAAMKNRLTLRIEAPVSGKLLTNLDRYQHIICEWFPQYCPIEIVPEEITDDARIAEPAPPDGTGFFFTGGIDSFYTYLGLREELTHALFIYGFDCALEDPAFRAFVSGHLHRATDEMGVELIETETNMLRFTQQHCDFVFEFHGAALAATARLFSNRFRKVAISSSNAVTDLYPVGSHPFTDPLWSGDGFEVVHYGANANRYEKLVGITKSDLAMRFLRVCPMNVEGLFNCCRCEKCLRTMVALRIAGKLDDCPLFPLPLDLSLLPEVRYTSAGNQWDWRANFYALRQIDDPELEEALEELKRCNIAASTAKQVARHGNLMLASPEWHRLTPKLRNKFLRNFKEADPDWYAAQTLSSVEENRDEAFDLLWERHRKWLKRRLRQAESRRRRKRLSNPLRRFGIGQKPPG